MHDQPFYFTIGSNISFALNVEFFFLLEALQIRGLFLLAVSQIMFDRPTVMKFGGTSIEDANALARVARIVGAQQESRPVIVVSAMSRVTDALLAEAHRAVEGDAGAASERIEEQLARHVQIAAQLLKSEQEIRAFQEAIERARRELADLFHTIAARLMPFPFLQDVVVSHGERLSATLLAAVLREHELPARYVDARRCIITDEEHTRATPLANETKQHTRKELLPIIEAAHIPVLGGFIAASRDGSTTTLGRGGSDYTAALIGAALDAREIQIWTDVAGVLTADPRIVSNARTVQRMSYREAAELAYFGAKVLHPKTIQPAIDSSIPVRICNSRAPEEAGTIVCAGAKAAPRTVKAIAHKTGVLVMHITSTRMLGTHGFLHLLFEIFDRHKIVVDVVATSEVSVSLSIEDSHARLAALKDLEELGTVTVDEKQAIICIVGEGLRATPGVAARVFSAISDINIALISQGASSINLTFAIDEAHIREAVTRLHEALFERENDPMPTNNAQAAHH